MDRPRRDSPQHNGITVRGLSQPTSATKSATNRHGEGKPRKGNTAQRVLFRAELLSAELRI